MNPFKVIRLVTILTLLLAVISCGGAEDRKQKYLTKGIEYYSQNNIDKARVEFKNVLQIDPKSAEGYFYIAQIDEKLKNYQTALGEYNKSIELKADYIDPMVGAARIYLIANAADKTLEISEKALLISPDNIDVMAVRAGALYRIGKKDQAIRDLTYTLDENPDHLASLVLMTRIYLSTHRVDMAKNLLTKALLRKPNSTSLKVLLVRLYSDAGQFDNAAQSMSELIASYPDNLSYRLRQAYFYDRLDEKDKAEQVLRTAVKVLPDDMQAKQNLIQYLAEKRSVSVAQNELARIINDDSNTPQLQLISAELYRKAKEIEKAESVYREIIRQYNGDTVAVSAQYQLARLLFNEKRFTEVKIELAQLLKLVPTHNEALTMRGIMLLAAGDMDGAITDFRSVLKDQPQSIKLIKLLAQAYLQSGKINLALEQFKILFLIKPDDIDSRMTFAALLHKTKQFSDAVEQLEIVLLQQPEYMPAKHLIFKVYLADHDYTQALQLAQKMQKNPQHNVTGYFYHGLVLQLQNKLEQSMSLYEKALQIKPDAIEPLSSYVRAALALQQADKAEAKLKSLIKKNADDAVIQNLLGEVLLQQKKYSAAANVFSRAIAINSKWWVPYRNLVSAQLGLQQKQEVMNTYREGIKNAEKPERLVTLYAGFLEQQNKIDEAIKLYEEWLVSNPESLVGANNLALLLADYKSDQPSKDRALSLVSSFQNSDNASFLDTLGWVHYRRGEFDKAIAALLQADKMSPEQALIYYHLGKSYFAKGDTRSAYDFLQKVEKSTINLKAQQDAKRILLSMDKA